MGSRFFGGKFGGKLYRKIVRNRVKLSCSEIRRFPTTPQLQRFLWVKGSGPDVLSVPSHGGDTGSKPVGTAKLS